MLDLSEVWNHGRILFGAPNLDWCEAPVPGLFEEPANTLSNLAYVVVAVLILRGAGQARHVRYVGHTVFWMGLCSLVYHASNNALSQVLDFVGMFAFLGLLLTYNARRLGLLGPANFRFHLGTAVMVNLLLLVSLRAFGLPIQMIVVANSVVILGAETILFWRTRVEAPARYGMLSIGLVLMAAASVCSTLDLERIWCDPHDHVFQGHAAWHLLSAGAIFCFARFYAQFDADDLFGARG